jgi:hypothetical protein
MLTELDIGLGSIGFWIPKFNVLLMDWDSSSAWTGGSKSSSGEDLEMGWMM